MPARPVRPRRKSSTPAPKAQVKRTGHTGERGSAIASKIVPASGSEPKVAGVMTFTGRKSPNLVPPGFIEIGRNTKNPGGPAPAQDHMHNVGRPKDVFIDEKPRTKKKR
jgi:hypothetical protein